MLRFLWLALRMYRLGWRGECWSYPSKSGRYRLYTVDQWKRMYDWEKGEFPYWKVSSGGATYSKRFKNPLEAARKIGDFPCNVDCD